jgi:hypothetical protein
MTVQPVVVQLNLSGLRPETIGAIAVSDKGEPGGVASLDSEGKVLAEQLPTTPPSNGGMGTISVEVIEDIVYSVLAALMGAPNGIATLNDARILSVPQQPNGMLFFYNYNQPFGVAKLDEDARLEVFQLPLPLLEKLASLEEEVQSLKAGNSP